MITLWEFRPTRAGHICGRGKRPVIVAVIIVVSGKKRKRNEYQQIFKDRVSLYLTKRDISSPMLGLSR